MEQSNSEFTDVVISKGNLPKECVLNGLDKLGGISNYVNDGDQVFIKFNLTLPQGFPTNTNMDTLEAIIKSCIDGGAKKVYVGSFPFKGITVKAISDLLGLKSYFLKIGAELVFLDYSDYYHQKNINAKHLKIIKNRNFSKVNVSGKEFRVPKIILDSDKFITVNQVNVDPIFKLRLSILNSYILSVNSYQDKISRSNSLKDLSSHIVDVFSLRKPDLVFNDIFYILERAGPYIYKDSNLKKTGLMIIGSDAVAVDTMTLKLLNYELMENKLLQEAVNKNLGISEISKIKVIGENLDNIKIIIEDCVSQLEDINLPNFSIKTGKVSLGDFEQAYHFLNFLKTNMIKDIKYISKTSFLIGENPPEPEFSDNIIIFGKSAIESIKLNKKKNALKLPGDPPNIFDCIDLLVKYYGKSHVPTLNFFQNLTNTYLNTKIKQKLKIWDGI